MEWNFCDHNHQTTEETRLLPTAGGGNMIVCYNHYRAEMKWRAEHKKKYNSDQEIPTWGSLKIYNQKIE